jgi:hypothetical protein
MKMRITQALSDMIKKNLLQYGQTYLNWDMQWPESGSYPIKFFPFYTNFKWLNLRTDPLLLDIVQFSFNFTTMAKDNEEVVYFRIPVVKKWAIYFDYDYRYMFRYQGSMAIEFHDLEATVAMTLKATEHGYLYPKIHDVRVKIANSILHHPNWFMQYYYRQMFDIGKYIVQNGINYFGPSLFNKNIFPISKSLLSEQIMSFPLAIPQLLKNDTFNLNWRLTADPSIHNNVLDLSMLFDIGPD